MAVKALEERMKRLARESIAADIRYKRKFERELEKDIERYRQQTPILFREAEKGQTPRTILAEGDSWWRYVIGFAVQWHLARLDARNHILNIASPGDTVAEMLSGDKARRLRRLLKSGPARNRKFDAVMFSGGGNDLVGNARFRRYLRMYEDGMTAKQCINAVNLRKALDLLEGFYEELILMRDELSRKSKLYLNVYDFAQASGIGVCGRPPWLQPHLIDAGIPDELHEDVVAVFLMRFRKRMDALATRLSSSNNIIVVETQGTLGPDQWENEIHPTKGGFRAIAKVFQKQLAADFP